MNGKTQLLPGQYSPQEFGRLTLWQMKILFGFRGDPPKLTPREAFWNRHRYLGTAEFEIWRLWVTQKRAEVEEAERIRSQHGRNASPHR